MKFILVIFMTIVSTFSLAKNPVVVMITNKGEIEIELNEKLAPLTVKNFLRYVDEGFCAGTIFHRVINGFMIQGGGMNEKMEEKKTHSPIKNEAFNGLKNEVGTIAMARTGVVDSATAQFFINVENNVSLNHRDQTNAGFGYAVFGKVIKGMHVVDRIKAVKTGNLGGHQNVPMDSVIIKSVSRKK